MFFDNLAIPKDAPHVAEAYAFIDYLQRPEVAARNTNLLSYANGNLASQKFVDQAILDDRSVYPDAATMARLFTIHARDPQAERVLNRIWIRIKTGR
jgi:putrescine transport system substrate-binding protein